MIHRLSRILVLAFTYIALCLTGTPVWATCLLGIGDCTDSVQVPYCNNLDSNSACNISNGVNAVKKGIPDIIQDRSFSQWVQDIVAYLLYFLTLLSVLYILWAGFMILTAGPNDENVKKGRKIILHVCIGIVLIFMAYSIVTFVIQLVNPPAAASTPTIVTPATSSFVMPIDHAYADDTTNTDSISPNAINTFDQYSTQIQLLQPDIEREYKVDEKISAATLNKLEVIVRASETTFPDDKDRIYNSNLLNNVLTGIALVRKHPDSQSSILTMAKSLSDFLTTIKIGRIKSGLLATPAEGNAPLVVSLTATNTNDPSGITIPKENYLWSLQTGNGQTQVIGQGPSIVYTFQDESTYTVFLDITSPSRNSHGKTDVLPFRSSLVVHTLPRIGEINLSVNGNDISQADMYKISPAVGNAGVILDASTTHADGNAQITSYTWDFGNGNRVTRDGVPRIENQVYANAGTYTSNLLIHLNTGKTMEKKFELDVRDPVAYISSETDIKSIHAHDTVKFAAASSLDVNTLSYTWEVVNLSDSSALMNGTDQTISVQFPSPGRYNVRLKTMDPTGKTDQDSIVIVVATRDPIAEFDMGTLGSETPNIITLDATRSYDPDTLSGDRLTYSWYIDGQRVTLDRSSRNGAIGQYTFGTLGTHKVRLDAINESGHSTSVTRDIDIRSLLSVYLTMDPKIAQIGQNMTFIAQAKAARIYEWSFGDGSAETTNGGRINHIYKSAGTYRVNLTVRGTNSSDMNTISRDVFVVATDQPFATMSLKKNSQDIFPQDNVCNGNEGYIADRVDPIAFDASDSIDVSGKNSNLDYFWQYDDKTASQENFSYKFDELGCHKVSLTVTDKTTHHTSTSTTYIRTDNALPTMSALDITTDTKKDPVVVNITARNAKDPDGVIVSYLWYYYTDSDPEPQDYRMTSVPKTAFVLPKVSGTYYFAVVMEDSNGGKINTDDNRNQRFSITIASDNINTPLISLTATKNDILVGDQVGFKTVVKNVIGKDISDKVEYKWDFDGDGFYDATTTTPDTTYVYPKPGNFNMKVKVTYKGISNTKYINMLVKNVLKPNMQTVALGDRLIVFNTTQGAYSKVAWDGGAKIKSDNPYYIITHSLTDADWPVKLTMSVSDGTDTKEFFRIISPDRANILRIQKSSRKLIMFTYPQMANNTITVDTPGQPIFIYLGESKGDIGRYVIDEDTSVDSDLNGNPNDDPDNQGTPSILTGEPFVIRGLSTADSERTMRFFILDKAGKIIESQDVKVILAYNQGHTIDVNASGSGSLEATMKDISERDKVNLEKLKNLIQDAPTEDRTKLMQMLATLQEGWFDSREKTRGIIDMQSYIDQSKIDDAKKNAFYDILDSFMYAENQTKDDTTLAINVIRSLIPKDNANYTKIMADLDEIASHPTDVPDNKNLGKEILNFIKDDASIPQADKMLIKTQLTTIINGSQTTGTGATVATTQAKTTGGAMDLVIGFFKVIGYLLGFVVLLFVAFFVYFQATNKREGLAFQDFLIELFSGKTTPKSKTPKAMPEAKKPEPPKDILAESENETVPSREPSPLPSATIAPLPTPEPEKIPDWMRPTHPSDSTDSSDNEFSTPPEPTPAVSNDMPSWMQNIASTSTTETSNENESFAPQTETLQPSVVENSQDDAIPDWMRIPTATPDLPREEAAESSNNEPNPSFEQLVEKDVNMPNWLDTQTAETTPIPETNPTETPLETIELPNIPTAPTPPVVDDANIPDWLRIAPTPAPTPAPAAETPAKPQQSDRSRPSSQEP